MIGKLNHVAIAVPNLEAASAKYRDVFGAEVSSPENLPEHGVTTVFVTLPNTKIELICPLGDNSPIAGFLQRHPEGGVHHLCYEVENIKEAKESLEKNDIRILGGGHPKIGAHGKPVLFLHPKDCFGTLIEIEEI